MNLKGNNKLRLITIVTLLYSAFVFFKYSGGLLGLLFESGNPLIPSYLKYYIAFPSYFVVPFFLIIIVACVRILKLKEYNYKVVYFLFGLALLFLIFQLQIYDVLMSINPYRS